jgi:uncharacterized RDD family membrane protein YckC
MESLDILTGQNVTIQYEPANLLRRMGAVLLDGVFMLLYIAVCAFFLGDLIQNTDLSDDPILIVVVLLLSLPLMLYHFLFESLMGGRTPGKIIANIKVTNVDGSTPGLLAYFLRWILLPIDMMPYGGIGALCILFSKNHQRLGDMAAGTSVVRSASATPLTINSLLYELDDDYQPTFKDVDLLSEGQILFISNMLQNSSDDIIAYSAIELADKIKQKLHIKTDMDDRTFLETIVRDYNHYEV